MKRMITIDDLPNEQFYEEYDGEPEVTLCLNDDDSLSLRVWEGYFADIFKHPDLTGYGWTGFTRDYHEGENAFSEESCAGIDDIDEYLEDLRQYVGSTFEYEESSDCLDMLCDFLTLAKQENCTVTVTSS